jgi:diguanylate cyclase (GGDEF)-like protein/PAS domain S-box-containing protein
MTFMEAVHPDLDVSLPVAQVMGVGAHRSLRFAAWLCAALVVLLGAGVLTGWLFGFEPLMSVLPGHIRMKPNTAVAFITAGTALGFILWGRPGSRRLSQFLSIVTLSCGASALFEYFLPINLGLDQLLFIDTVQIIHPGLMAPLTGANFCLAGTSLFLLGGGRRAQVSAQWAALLLISCAFAAMVSYLYGVELFYGSLGFTAMALHTGVGFLLLGTGLVVAQPKSALMLALSASERGGWLVRRLLPSSVLLPVALGWVYLQPKVDFDYPRFGMALFAVTLASTGTGALMFVGMFLTREQRQRAEISRMREMSAAAIQQSERELRLINDHLPTLLFYIDTEERLIRVNRTFEVWLGLPSDAIVGRTLSALLGSPYSESTSDAHEAVRRGETVTFEAAFPTTEGAREVQVTYAPDMDETMQLRGTACMVLDIGERRRAEAALLKSERLQLANEVLQELSFTDQLTGVKNRRAFDERLNIDFALAERHNHDLSLMMIDIDNFKIRNDTWGHAAGDEALQRLGLILAGAVRNPDLVARYGGEEFTILLPQSHMHQAMVVADRIRLFVQQENWPHTNLTLSIGIATRTEGMTDPQALVDAADCALYGAKRAGRDRICSAEEARFLGTMQ